MLPAVRQLLQDVASGKLSLGEVPAPARGAADLLVANRFSVISPGTERAVLELGRASLLGKARARPDLVAKVVEAARAEGLGTTYAKVRGRLGEPNPLGYSCSGMVLEACDGAPAAPGELVACAGAGFAAHAEVISVPRHLTARVPEEVPPEDAAYATIASIALHGVRLTQVGLGDVVAVVGLGLVGQLTMQLLVAAGAVPVGVDPEPARVELACEHGLAACHSPEELEAEVARLTERRGADGVLVTAASESSAPLTTATMVARERAVIAIVGDVKVEAHRGPLFAKELQLVVSRSYGPGRYDPTYEEKGIDYPAAYVRWTEGRNLGAVLALMAKGTLRPSRLTTHTFDFAECIRAYELLEGEEESLGILLRYPAHTDAGPRSVPVQLRRRNKLRRTSGRPRLGVVGAGSFARGVLLPILARTAYIAAVANRTGPSATAAARRFGAGLASTEAQELIDSAELDGVVIATRHDTHAELACRALDSGKHVFVEKPLALDEEELERVVAAAAGSTGILMVGFNRRHAPLTLRLRDALGGRGPLVMTYRVSAGRLPRDHWVHDPEVGGGRIVAEICHFVDLLSFLCGGSPERVVASAPGGGSAPREDSVAATISFSDGSVGQITYAAIGDPALAKERVEVMGESGSGVLDDFRELHLYRSGQEQVISGKRDKGHAAELSAFVEACQTGQQPWPTADMAAVTRTTYAIRDAVMTASDGSRR